MKEKIKKLSKKVIFAIVAGTVIGTILLTALGMQIAFLIADKIECWRPDYEMVDIAGVLDKDGLSDEDYDLLYRQTGLTKTGIDRALEDGDRGKQLVLRIQSDLFTEHKVINDFFAPYVCQDKIDGFVENIYLKDGDIIVSSSTHLSGWRIGHAGLVTNGKREDVLQASTIGSTSMIGSIFDFTDRVNFIILSPIADDETKAEVVNYAKENLTGKIYDPTAGVFSSKNKVEKTQCAHLVWYAYKQFGIDVDGNGGLVVTPKNIARSPNVEVVQAFGFDLNKLW